MGKKKAYTLVGKFWNSGALLGKGQILAEVSPGVYLCSNYYTESEFLATPALMAEWEWDLGTEV